MHIHTELKALLSTSLGEAAYALCTHLHSKGYNAYMVGGAVRNCILGLSITDIDIATNANPEQIEEICTVIPQHGTAQTASVRVKFYGKVFEVTTFRTELYSKESRTPARIEFTDRKGDSIRRDFTINALYADILSGAVYDDVNGLADLHERVVRFIGNAEERIREDSLRILRGVRLKNTILGQYEPETYRNLRKYAPLVKQLPRPTLWKEFEKIIRLPNANEALEDLWELNILEQYLPELSVLKGIAQPLQYHKEGDVWQHTLLAVKSGSNSDITTKMAILFHDVGKASTYTIENDRIHFNDHASYSKKIVEEIGKRFQLEKNMISKISFLVAHHMMIGNILQMSETRKAHWYFHPWFRDLLEVFYADIAGSNPSDYSLYNAVYHDYSQFIDAHPKKPVSILNGKEIMTILCLKPSPVIENIKEAIVEEMISGTIQTKKQAISFVQNWSEKIKE